MRLRPICGTLCALALAGCGDGDAPLPAPASSPPAAHAAPPEREVIPPEDLEEQRAQVLKPRDVPLAVGAPAPTFAGYPEKGRAVIVFFRGEW
jgi:hypothetical protein